MRQHHPYRFLPACLALVCLFLHPQPLAMAQPTVEQSTGDQPQTGRKFVVATKHSPPFSFKDDSGQWTGISIELWEHIAKKLDISYEFREMELNEMLQAVASGDADAAIAAISVTPEREKTLDFTHSYFTTGLGVATARSGERGFWGTLSSVFSVRFFMILGVMLAITLTGGVLFWLLERRAKTGPFTDRRKGVRDGIWWSIVILLGHKGVTPTTSAARAMAATGMFASLLALSTLTGAIASVLTVGQLDTVIQRPDDLRRVRVVTIPNSTSAAYLTRRRISHVEADTIDAALNMLKGGRADAVVYDAPSLKYLVNQNHRDTLLVLPWSFQQQEYAIALASGSPIREPMNHVLLTLRDDDKWGDIRFRYLGDSSAP